MGEPTPGPDTPDHDSDTADGARPADGLAASNGAEPERVNGRERARANGQAGGRANGQAGRTTGRPGAAGAASRNGAEPDAGTEAPTGAHAAGHAPEPDADGPGEAPRTPGAGVGTGAGTGAGAGKSRRPPTVTRDTARPEGGGRAAPGDAPAPARQWPLLTVIGLAALGLLIVGTDPFPQAFRIGTILVGVALLTGAALRRWLPSVGMLAVRSRFTDMVTYGLLGTVIVLLALMVQPRPWLKIPFLEEVVRFTVR
ncbi:DUF3017 domain-containing protein [Streptomyces sp. NPDC059909]|uniref:DUF3017 domain-containing protein n=1 Tax=Streptomyces sp. NPDC059909 TaxID=3346998 RepID=UPI003647E94B